MLLTEFELLVFGESGGADFIFLFFIWGRC